MTSAAVDASLEARVFFKRENLQRTGACKFRGAFNALSRLSAEAHARSVVAYSSGNHAQAVALAARLARDAGAPIIPPYDHPDVIAGQGTAAAELIDEVGPIDSLFVCLGGGGLLAGSLLAAKTLAPACRVYGVEPEAGNDAQLSLRAGSIVRIDVPKTIADGAQTQSLGKLTFEIIRRAATGILTATDADLVASMRLFAEQLKIVVEPTGCLAFAGARRHAADLKGRRVGVIVSGGNVDADRYAALLSGEVTRLWP